MFRQIIRLSPADVLKKTVVTVHKRPDHWQLAVLKSSTNITKWWLIFIVILLSNLAFKFVMKSSVKIPLLQTLCYISTLYSICHILDWQQPVVAGLPWSFACVWVMAIAHVGLTVEVRGQNAVGGTSSEGSSDCYCCGLYMCACSVGAWLRPSAHLQWNKINVK